MEITESVLTSVKKLLGIDEGYTHFDADIVMHINSVFPILTQMGRQTDSPLWGKTKAGPISFLAGPSCPWSNPMSA